MPRKRSRFLLSGIVAAALATAGCDEGIAHYRVPKQAPAPADSPGSGGAVMASADLASPPAAPGATLGWTLPEGWTEARGGSAMRYATLRPPVEGEVDVSVTVLAGDAGGELANVNRWRGQIGLGPIDEADLARARTAVGARLGPVSLYDFTSDGTPRRRVVAGFAQARGSTWFVKMSGDEGPVGAARPDFVRIVESLRLE